MPSATEGDTESATVSPTNNGGVRHFTLPLAASTAATPAPPSEQPAHCPYRTPPSTTMPENTSVPPLMTGSAQTNLPVAGSAAAIDHGAVAGSGLPIGDG